MRLQIATLVALVASSSVLAVPGPTGGDIRLGPQQFGPRRGDIQLGKSSGTRGLLTDKQTKLLGDKAKEIAQALETVCEKYAHSTNAGHLKQRGIFGDDVRLAARDAAHDAEEIEKWGATTHAIIKSVEAACVAWVHAKDSSHLQQRGIIGDGARLDARDPKFSLAELKKWRSTAGKILKSADAAYNAFNSRDLRQRGIFGDEVRLGARDLKIPYELRKKWEAENSRLMKILIAAGPDHYQEHQKELQELQDLTDEMIKWDLERPRP